LSGETALAHFRPIFGQDSAHPAHNMRRGATGTRATKDGGAPGGTPVMRTPPSRQEAIDATRAQVEALQLEVDVLSVQSAGSRESTGEDPAPRVGSLADWQQPALETRQSSTASRSSKEVKSWKRKHLLELVNANVPQSAAVLMVEDHISLAFAGKLGAAEMATFFTDKGMHFTRFDANRMSVIFSPPPPACEPPLSVPPAPPPPQSGPVLASRLAFPPGMGGPGIAAQISGGGGGAVQPPTPAPATAGAELAEARGEWLFNKCARKECPCAATFNGQAEQYCCPSCRDGTACTIGVHAAPSAPDKVLGDRKLLPMPTTLVHGISLMLKRGLPIRVGIGLETIVAMLYAWQCDDAAITGPQAAVRAAVKAAERGSALAAAAALATSPPTTPTGLGAATASLSADELSIIAECRHKAKQLGGDLAALFEDVPDAKMQYVLTSLMLLYEATRGLVSNVTVVDFQRFAPVILTLHVLVAASFSEAGYTGPAALKQCSKKTDDKGEIAVMALTLAVTGNNANRARGGSGGGWASGLSESPNPQMHDTVRTAAGRIADVGSAEVTLEKIVELAKEAGTDVSKNTVMLAELQVAQRNSEFGADLALLLGQEKLLRAPSGVPSNTGRVWNLVWELYTRVPAARVVKFEQMLPTAVDDLELVTAVGRGKVTMSLICGKPEKTATFAEQKAAVLDAWPVLVALHRECFPRGADDAQQGLLEMAHDSFDRSRTAEAAVKAISPCLAAMATRFASYTRQGGAPPSWVKVRFDTTVCGSKDSQIATYLHPTTLDPDADTTKARTAWADAQAAKAARKEALEAETKAKADAAAKAKVDAGGKGGKKPLASFA
jgi:hypothetical protein